MYDTSLPSWGRWVRAESDRLPGAVPCMLVLCMLSIVGPALKLDIFKFDWRKSEEEKESRRVCHRSERGPRIRGTSQPKIKPS